MIEKITLGGGCFWCIEAVFAQVVGVESVESGYSNGQTDKPTYQEVCKGDTGHNEVVRVSFDSNKISLQKILDIFFKVHDATLLNRQGGDIGTQYRSGVYAHSAEQLTQVLVYMEALAHDYLANAITTEVVMEQNYHCAEDYHQNYFANNPHQGYCAMVVSPKVKKFQMAFPDMLH